MGPTHPHSRFEVLWELADEFAIRAHTCGIWTARLEVAFNRIEHGLIEYEDGALRIQEWDRGLEMGWLPATRREFEASRRN
jgi:hypothetical protein